MRNLVVLAAGHSGTTVLVRMLHALGWNWADADKPYAEMNAARRVNAKFIQEGTWDNDAAEIASDFPDGWVMKDPRLCITFPNWEPIFEMKRIVLVHLERNFDRVHQSYVKRGLVGAEGHARVYGKNLSELRTLARHHFVHWEGDKISLDYENIAAAAQLFEANR